MRAKAVSSFSIPANSKHRYHVYAMLCQDGDGPGYVKFGHSSRIGKRLATLRVACPIPARYFAVVDIGWSKTLTLATERGLHQQFRCRKITGEWFRFDFSAPEDKRAFNEGSKAVFSSIHTLGNSWWSKISVAALDKYQQEKRDAYLAMDGENKRKAKARANAANGRRSPRWRDLDKYLKAG